MKVFKALYNPMTEESGYVTLSIHLSKEGALKVLDDHKAEKLKEWKKLYKDDEEEPFPFGTFEDWEIGEVEILP